MKTTVNLTSNLGILTVYLGDETVYGVVVDTEGSLKVLYTSDKGMVTLQTQREAEQMVKAMETVLMLPHGEISTFAVSLVKAKIASLGPLQAEWITLGNPKPLPKPTETYTLLPAIRSETLVSEGANGL